MNAGGTQRLSYAGGRQLVRLLLWMWCLPSRIVSGLVALKSRGLLLDARVLGVCTC